MSLCKVFAVDRFSHAEMIGILQTKDKTKFSFSDILSFLKICENSIKLSHLRHFMSFSGVCAEKAEL